MMTPRLYWIVGRWAGRLAVSVRPRGGDWLRDEVKGWRESGVDIVISLLTPDEVDDLSLNEEGARCQEEGLGFISFPIADRSVPGSREAAQKLLKSLDRTLATGKTVVIHCRQGLGRSALIAASILALEGAKPEEAFARLTASRGSSVPETEEQRKWVEEFARDVAPAPLAS
jgi:protein-tyrosine phosphatase